MSDHQSHPQTAAKFIRHSRRALCSPCRAVGKRRSTARPFHGPQTVHNALYIYRTFQCRHHMKAGLSAPHTWTISRTAASPVTEPQSARELARPATVPSWVTQSPPHEKNASKKQSPAFMERAVHHHAEQCRAHTVCSALPHTLGHEVSTEL